MKGLDSHFVRYATIRNRRLPFQPYSDDDQWTSDGSKRGVINRSENPTQPEDGP
jgi:hypothetical protein